MTTPLDTLTCHYKYCKLIYDQPVMLPCCGESLCQKHVEDLQIPDRKTTIKCCFCSQEFELPEKGLILNKCILKLVETVNFGEMHEKAKSSLGELESKINDLKYLIYNSCSFITSHFDSILNEINVQREDIKAFIDRYYDQLVAAVELNKTKCLTNREQTKPNLTDFNIIEIISQRHEKFKEDLRRPLSDDKVWYELTNNIFINKIRLNTRIEKIKTELLLNNSYKFIADKINPSSPKKELNANIIGKFSVKSLLEQSPPRIENNVSTHDYSNILSCSDDKNLFIWQIEPFIVKKKLTFPSDPKRFDSLVVISKNHIITTGREKKIFLWNLTDCSCEKVFLLENYPKYLVKLNDSEFLCGNNDGEIQLWKVEDNDKPKKRYKSHQQPITCLEVIKERNQMVSSSFDRTIKLWDLISGECLKTFFGHTGTINSLKVSLEINKIISCSNDKTAILWDMTTNEKITLRLKSQGLCLELLPDKKLAVGQWSGTITVWNLDTYHIYRECGGTHKLAITCIKYLPKENKLASCSFDKSIYLWNINGFTKDESVKEHVNPILFLSLI